MASKNSQDPRIEDADLDATPDAEPPHADSPTAVAGEAFRTGLLPPSAAPREEVEVPGQDDLLEVGDPDVSALSNAYVGDEAPGASMPTPDQDDVDATGRAYGISGADSGALHSSAEMLDARDQRRAQQEGPGPREEE